MFFNYSKKIQKNIVKFWKKKMFFACSLLDKTKLCIPASWLQNIDIVRCFNNLHKRHEKKVIFYSKDELSVPNFLLPKRDSFDEHSDGCYDAYVLKAFETKHSCVEYLFNIVLLYH